MVGTTVRRSVCRWYSTEPLILVLSRKCSDTPLSTLALQVGLDRRTLERVRSRHRLRSDAADRISVALGHHPSELWPEWFSAEDGGGPGD
jgi:lambda repressor-like predicted transcriptional regulator